jgi:hypothetical protein
VITSFFSTLGSQLHIGMVNQTSWETLLFSAETGPHAHRWPDVCAAGAADLDDDGCVDLYGHDRASTFRTHRGIPDYGWREAWRRPGRWRALPFKELGSPSGKYLTRPGPDGDLDGDGVPDVLLLTPPPPEGIADGGEPPILAWRAPSVGEPLGDEPVVRGPTLRSAEPAEIVVLAVERDDGLSGGAVKAVRRGAKRHACGSFPSESGSLPDCSGLLGRTVRRGQVS